MNDRPQDPSSPHEPGPLPEDSSWEVPGELTGITPEEEAFTPPPEPRPLPRGLFAGLGLLLLLAFVGGGFWYYRHTVLPEKHFQEASRLYEARRYAPALKLFRKVLKERPERKDTLFQIGVCLESLGRPGEALDAFASHLENQPRDEGAWIRTGRILLSLGRPESALDPLEKAVRLAPKNREAQRLLGEVYRRLGSRDRAVEHLSLALTWNPDQVDALLRDAKALMGLKAYGEALRGYRKAAELAPEDPRPKHGLWAARAQLGLPNDDRFFLVPGKSLGPVALGLSKEEVLARFGDPDSADGLQTPGGKTFEVWRFPRLTDREAPGKAFPGCRMVFDEDGRLVQAESASPAYKTEDGLGVASFLNKRYAKRFSGWQETDHRSVGYRYALKEGGLTFYVSDLGGITPDGERRAAVVHTGPLPADDRDQPELWLPVKPPRED